MGAQNVLNAQSLVECSCYPQINSIPHEHTIKFEWKKLCYWKTNTEKCMELLLLTPFFGLTLKKKHVSNGTIFLVVTIKYNKRKY